MNTERSIKLVHCGDQEGGMFNDRISIEFSPGELSLLEMHFRVLALNAEDYDSQTVMREMCEAFDRASDMWEARVKRVNK